MPKSIRSDSPEAQASFKWFPIDYDNKYSKYMVEALGTGIP